MEYYVIYKNDDLIAYCDNIYELCDFSGLRIKDVNYKFKHAKDNVININVDKSRFKVYKFF